MGDGALVGVEVDGKVSVGAGVGGMVPVGVVEAMLVGCATLDSLTPQAAVLSSIPSNSAVRQVRCQRWIIAWFSLGFPILSVRVGMERV